MEFSLEFDGNNTLDINVECKLENSILEGTYQVDGSNITKFEGIEIENILENINTKGILTVCLRQKKELPYNIIQTSNFSCKDFNTG